MPAPVIPVDLNNNVLGGMDSPNIVASVNNVSKFRDSFDTFVPGQRWIIDQQGAGDIIQLDGNAAGASYLVISKDPFTPDTKTRLRSATRFKMPYRLGFGLSMSQRDVPQWASVSVVSGNDAPLTQDTAIAITSIQQVTTTLTINTATPHNLAVGDKITIFGVSAPQLNYHNVTVSGVNTPTNFTVTAGSAGALPSVSLGPLANGFIRRIDPLEWRRNGAGMFFEGSSNTAAAMYVRSEGGKVIPSGTVAGQHCTVTIGSTVSNQAAAWRGQYAFWPTTAYEITGILEQVVFADVGVDVFSGMTTRQKRNQIVPNPERDYEILITAENAPGLSRPVAAIVSATKSASTTATIVTATPHGLAVNDTVIIVGIRDQTNFANQTTAVGVASVVNATTFTVVFGASATATSYGGYVAIGAGARNPAGVVTQVLQSVSRTANIVSIVANAAITGCQIGDYVNLFGVRDNTTGADIGVDGSYRVVNVNGTAAEFEPIGNAPTGGTISSTNCGGGIIKRTDVRMHFFRVIEHTRVMTDHHMSGRNDSTTAIPTIVTNTPLVLGNTAIDGVFPSPVGIGPRAANANPAAMSANGDIVGMLATMIGAIVQKPYAIPEAVWNANLTLTTATPVVIAAAAGAGIRRYIAALQAINTGASAVDLIILDGAVERWRLTLPVNVPTNVPFPIELLTTANTALNANLSAVGTVVFNAQGYTAP